ncbi:MAG: carboxypeptidase regulatory-like domain-containing protein [Planctomycetota bacterium]|nr:MAG: carboxypeptidase regulatory-like domain-containing protein [Planctomycetota bacterium]
MRCFLLLCAGVILFAGVGCGGSGSGDDDTDPSEDPGLHLQGFVEDEGQRQAGVTVRLFYMDEMVAETTSDGDGEFLFSDLEGDLSDYRVRVVGVE